MENTENFYPSVTDIPQQKTLAFTGHRPEKLPQGAQLDLLLSVLYYYIDLAIDRGYRYFLDGMADGIDYLAEEYLFRKKSEYPDICLIGVQPCRNYDLFFRHRGYDLQHLRQMQEHFDRIICLAGEYHQYDGRKNDILFRNRNLFLAEHAAALIAVCSLDRSGSKQTYDYAKELGLAICRIEANPVLFYTPRPDRWPVEKINF